MELTREYFDEQLKNLSTKQDLAALAKELKAHTTKAIDALARDILKPNFERLEKAVNGLADNDAIVTI